MAATVVVVLGNVTECEECIFLGCTMYRLGSDMHDPRNVAVRFLCIQHVRAQGILSVMVCICQNKNFTFV